MTPAEKEASLYAVRFVFRRIAYVVVFALVLLLGGVLRGVLVPLFLAFLLAYVLDPVVDRLARARVPRPLAALMVMLGLSGVLAAALTLAVPYFLDEFVDATAALPDQLTALRDRLDPWVAERLHVHIPASVSDVTRDYGAQIRVRLPEFALGLVPAVFGTFSMVVVLASALMIPVFALYLLMDFDVIVRRAAVLIPRRYALRFIDVIHEIHVTLGRYVRGQLTASLVLACIYSLGLRALGLRLAIPIGVLTGLLAFVPYVGFSIGLSMALAITVLDWHGPGTVVGVAFVMFATLSLDVMFVTPRIVGGSVGLKPIEVLLTMTAAATLFGFLGVLLAVPLGAVVKILVVRATRAYLHSPYYRQIPPPTTPTPLPTSARDLGPAPAPEPPP